VISGHLYLDGRPTGEPVDLHRISDLISRDRAFVWLDAVEPTDDDLTLVELFKDYAFVVVRPLASDGERGLKEGEIHALVGRRYVVTLRTGHPFPMEESVRRWERQPELLALGGGFAVYVLLDEVVDDYLSMVESFEDRADDLEDTIFDSGDAHADSVVQQQLFRLKRETVRLRRFAMPLRQGLDLIQEQPELSSSPVAPYYRDVMDHVIRVVELVDNIRDLLTSLLEVRVAQAANRMNEVMKSLTAWATILLVPTLLAGIWGMNFKHMPELVWRFGYPVAIGSILLSAFGLYAWFRWKKRWL
jgi:magnesium transporter